MHTLRDVRKRFPEAVVASELFAALSRTLEVEHGFTSRNTRFAEGSCCDEINEPELLELERRWGARFKFGGLAGYCHAGRTGLRAASQHVPEHDGRRNLLLVGGPHIGFHDGAWGRVTRPGQPEVTASCGALAALVDAGHEVLVAKPLDPLDGQQHAVARLLLPFLREPPPDATSLIVGATRFLLTRVDADLGAILDEVATEFDGQIACVTGVTINTATGNLFQPSTTVVRRGGQTSSLTVG